MEVRWSVNPGLKTRVLTGSGRGFETQVDVSGRFIHQFREKIPDQGTGPGHSSRRKQQKFSSLWFVSIPLRRLFSIHKTQ
ncbi:hypothetical protein AMELA_G00198750 [Ameiurus melas]|uniref:Uncharacterized protein n=1 Tax=Ameiurus melas TaxID=219545 RepID=A0A7J6A8N7_AMEME|nr:hypothetical protein AMELA_G00198750 [Ameiurus melas]